MRLPIDASETTSQLCREAADEQLMSRLMWSTDEVDTTSNEGNADEHFVWRF
jgi:hypothetical protein